jgi:hypothetical protein
MQTGFALMVLSSTITFGEYSRLNKHPYEQREQSDDYDDLKTNRLPYLPKDNWEDALLELFQNHIQIDQIDAKSIYLLLFEFLSFAILPSNQLMVSQLMSSGKSSIDIPACSKSSFNRLICPRVSLSLCSPLS